MFQVSIDKFNNIVAGHWWRVCGSNTLFSDYYHRYMFNEKTGSTITIFYAEPHAY